MILKKEHNYCKQSFDEVKNGGLFHYVTIDSYYRTYLIIQKFPVNFSPVETKKLFKKYNVNPVVIYNDGIFENNKKKHVYTNILRSAHFSIKKGLDPFISISTAYNVACDINANRISEVLYGCYMEGNSTSDLLSQSTQFLKEMETFYFAYASKQNKLHQFLKTSNTDVIKDVDIEKHTGNRPQFLISDVLTELVKLNSSKELG